MRKEEQKMTHPCRGCINDCTLVITKNEHGVQVFGNHCRKGELIGKEAYRDAAGTFFRGYLRVKGKLLPVRVHSSAPLDPSLHKKIRTWLRAHPAPDSLEPGAVIAANIFGTGIDLLCD